MNPAVKKLLHAAIPALIFTHSPAWAQLEEVVVTAQKREQSLQEVPMAINTFDEEFVREVGIKNIQDVAALTPGLSLAARGDTETSVFIRGIGSLTPGIGADPSVGVYVDGVYNARGTTALASFFDVERVEVVKGPQGTLFGRNAAAGAISIITNKPSTDETYYDVLMGVGNEGQLKGQLVANIAVSDRAAIRIGVNHYRRDPAIENTVGKDFYESNHWNYRVSGLLDVTDNWTSILSIEYIDVETSENYLQIFDSPALDPVAPTKDVISRNPAVYGPAAVNTPHAGDQYLESLKGTWTNTFTLSDNMSLTSITAFFDAELSALDVDLDGTEFEMFSATEQHTYDMFSQEFRLNGSSENTDWFAGASYSRENMAFGNAAIPSFLIDENLLLLPEVAGFLLDPVTGDPCAWFPGVCSSSVIEDPRGTNKTTSWAVYGDMTWHATDALDVTVGVRHTKDSKDGTYDNPFPTEGLFALLGGSFSPYTLGPIPASDSWSSTDPRIAFNYQINDDVSIFINAAKGYKSGGINRQVDAYLPEPQNVLTFDNEKNTSYELGFKSTLMDGFARLNGSIFYTDYKNLQLERFINLIPVIDNVGDLEIKGLELNGEVELAEGLNLSANYGYTDAVVVDSDSNPDLIGNDAVRAPKHTANVRLRYVKPVSDNGNVKASALYHWSDKFYFDEANLFEQEAYGVLNLRVGYEQADGDWGISLVGENVLDKEYLADAGTLFGIFVRPGLGSLWRVELTARF